jgi:hypothetical protein
MMTNKVCVMQLLTALWLVSWAGLVRRICGFSFYGQIG